MLTPVRLSKDFKKRHIYCRIILIANHSEKQWEELSLWREGRLLPSTGQWQCRNCYSLWTVIGTEYNSPNSDSAKKLPELITIFILSYDPFGEDALYYEAGSIIKTHPKIPYNYGVRRIFLYVNGKLPDNAGEDDKKLKNLLRYIGSSTKANVTDDTTKRLNEIVTVTKSKKDIGVRYMKSWEILRDAKEEGRKEGREEERANTRAETERADRAEQRADSAEQRVRELEAMIGV